MRAHVRFSNGSGDPGAADAARDGRGMAIKMYLPGGGTTDIVALSLPAFFARTPTDLLAFNEARRADPSTGQPDAGKVATEQSYIGELNDGTRNHMHNCNFFDVDADGKFSRVIIWMAGTNPLK